MKEHDDFIFTLKDTSPLSPEEDAQLLAAFLNKEIDTIPDEFLLDESEEPLAKAKPRPTEERAPESQGPNEKVIDNPAEVIGELSHQKPNIHILHEAIVTPEGGLSPIDREAVQFLEKGVRNQSAAVELFVNNKTHTASRNVRVFNIDEPNIGSYGRLGRNPVSIESIAPAGE